MRVYVTRNIVGSDDNTKELFKSVFIVKNMLKYSLSDNEFKQTLVNLYKALRNVCELPNNHLTVVMSTDKNDPDKINYVARIFDSIADGNVYDIHVDENGEWYIEIPDEIKEGESWDSNANEE